MGLSVILHLTMGAIELPMVENPGLNPEARLASSL
jgi:hypothetical protein